MDTSSDPLGGFVRRKSFVDTRIRVDQSRSSTFSKPSLNQRIHPRLNSREAGPGDGGEIRGYDGVPIWSGWTASEAISSDQIVAFFLTGSF